VMDKIRPFQSKDGQSHPAIPHLAADREGESSDSSDR
jgi:hypothetical protein